MANKVYKNDKYKKSRGGRTKMLIISCCKCQADILEYQKDGPGPLKRMYFDRIYSPKKLSGLENKNLKEIKTLKCYNCSSLIAHPYIYKKEKRKSFRVFQDSIIKKIKK